MTMKHCTRMTQKRLSHLLVFKPPFKSPYFFNEMLHNKTDWKKQLAKHLAMKAKDVNCLPAIPYMINLPSVRKARPLPGRRACYREEVVHGSLQPLDFVTLFLEDPALVGTQSTPGLTWGLVTDQTEEEEEKQIPTSDRHIPLIHLKHMWTFD